MTDSRNEGREESREEQRVRHLESVLERAREQHQTRVQRAEKALETLGTGSIYGTSVLLTLEQAEELALYLNTLKEIGHVSS